MKWKKLGILVTVAAVLAVMTTGIASAATYTFSGEFVTTLASDNGVVINYHSTGSKDVTQISDNLAWWNMFKNMKTEQRYGKITQTTSPSGGLTAGDSGWNSVPAGDGINPGESSEIQYVSGLDSVTSHTIYAVHKYTDWDNEWSSSANDMMSYY